ncbi:MAG: sporulation protein YtfJ [Clostridia bacterium]|nr:sporulation protein YtfJ [Clostridia bacterium]
MNEHPIEGLMLTAMNSIKDMVDVNTIIGEPIETSNNIIIIPISKVGFGFAAGGSEFSTETINEYNKKEKDEQISYKLPFGGGSGAGVSIAPVAFLVIQANTVKLLPINHSSAIDRLLDYVPDLIEKTNNILNKQMNNKKEEKQNEEKRKERERREEKEERKQNRSSEEIELRTPYIEPEQSTIIIPNTTKVQPRKAKMQKYEFEYDETESEE